MTSRARLITVTVIVAFLAFLLYATLEVQNVECTVTVEFKGEHRSATASGASEESATEQAQTAACGPLVQGHGREHRLLPPPARRPSVPSALTDSVTSARFPHPLTLLVACILIAAALSWVVPAGEYQRVEDKETGRNVVVAGTYAPVEATPVGPFQALVAIARGMIEASSVIFYVFLVGGAFAVVERTGALTRLVNSLVAMLVRPRPAGDTGGRPGIRHGRRAHPDAGRADRLRARSCSC